MNLCCMDNTQQKVMCKYLHAFPQVGCLKYFDIEVKWAKIYLTLYFISNRWSYGVVLYEISTIGNFFI